MKKIRTILFALGFILVCVFVAYVFRQNNQLEETSHVSNVGIVNPQE